MYMKMTEGTKVLICATVSKAIIDIYNFLFQVPIVIFVYSQRQAPQLIKPLF